MSSAPAFSAHTAAVAIRKRRYQVALFDPGPLPHPRAESTDISKATRMDYGADFERFPIFAADVSNTGYYGLPVTPDGSVKVANHGPGRQMDADDPIRTASPEQEAQLRDFLRDSIPGLADAPIVYSRLCLYCDTWDGHLWIDRDPVREGLTVATGGSGHAFKFAPILGDVIADAVEGRPGLWRDKFRWRPAKRPLVGEEAARYHG